MHKHHDGTGVAQISNADLFVLVSDPLSPRPKFFVGHSAHGPHTTTLRHQGKKMDATCAKAWHEFLTKAGHSFFVAVHHDDPKKPKPTTSRTIPKVLFKGEASSRRYY